MPRIQIEKYMSINNRLILLYANFTFSRNIPYHSTQI